MVHQEKKLHQDLQTAKAVLHSIRMDPNGYMVDKQQEGHNFSIRPPFQTASHSS